MPFQRILQNLVERVPGARGAVFVDGEGEYVELFARGPTEEMKLAGAHQGIVLNHFNAASERSGTGAPESIYVRNDGVELFARMLKEGYFVLLSADPHPVAGLAFWELARAAEEIEAEI